MVFSGADYRAPRDQARLSTQLERVKDAMIDGQWRSLEQIADLAQAPQTSVSAQLRNLRKPEFGSWLVDRRHIDRGLYEYRLRAQSQADLFEQKTVKPTRAEMREGFEQLRTMAKFAKAQGFQFDPVLVKFCKELGKKYDK